MQFSYPGLDQVALASYTLLKHKEEEKMQLCSPKVHWPQKKIPENNENIPTSPVPSHHCRSKFLQTEAQTKKKKYASVKSIWRCFRLHLPRFRSFYEAVGVNLSRNFLDLQDGETENPEEAVDFPGSECV